MRYIFQRQASLDPSFIPSFKLKSWVFVNGFKTDTCTLNSGTTSLNTFFIIWLNNWIELNLLRWLDWIFWGWYLPSLSINYVGMSKDMEKTVTTAVLYKDENFLWSGFYCNRSRHGNVMTPLRFSFIFVFLCSRSFLKKLLKGVCTCYNCVHYGKVWTNSMRAFSKYFEK